MKPQSVFKTGFRWQAAMVASAGILFLAAGNTSPAASALTGWGHTPISFEANHGQMEGAASFIARGPAYYFSLSPTEATVSLRKFGEPALRKLPPHDRGPVRVPVGFRSLQLEFLGANPVAQVAGENELSGRVNYFIGEAANWRTGVPLFGRVRVKQMYPGIDLVHYGNQEYLEYDFEVAPGADPSVIGIRFTGADRIAINREGDLVLTLGDEEIRQPRPVVYQEVNGSRRQIAGDYVLADARTVKFSIGNYDRHRALVIDPILSYASYYGGSGKDAGWGVVVAADGSVYITGETMGGLPLTAGTLTNRYSGGTSAHGDAFVVKFDNTGTNVIYRSYVGGTVDDVALALAVDGEGNAYITGWTDSGNFPRTNAIFNQIKGTPYPPPVSIYPAEAFVTKLGPWGTNLVFSTFLGSSAIDAGMGIAVDADGNTYVAGYTQGTNFPTANVSGSFTQYSGGYLDDDAFVTKISPAGTNLVYSMYLGGTKHERAMDIAADAAGLAYVIGYTSSTNFPMTTNASQPWFGGDYDAFVTVIGPFGSNLVNSTYLGGSQTNLAYRLALDDDANVYLTGATSGDSAYPITPSLINAGGVFRSVSGGLNWGAANDGLQSVQVFSLAVDPVNSMRVYAGTARGIARSVDEGATWNTSIEVAPMARIGNLGPSIAMGLVESVVVDPLRPAVVYASTSQGVFKSVDSGASWSLKATNLNTASSRTLAIDPVFPEVLYVGGDAGVYRSSNGATNWLSANSGLGNLSVRALAIDPATPSRVYAATAGGVYRTTNRGTNWVSANSGLGNRPSQALAVNPLSPTILYVGTTSGVFSSTNAGSNWVSVSGGLTTSNVTALAIDPVTPTTLYAGTTNGLFKSTDSGVTWTPQASGLLVPNILSVAVNPQSPGILYAGTSGKSSFGSGDVFVTKLGDNGFSAVFGGSGNDEGGDVAVATSGRVYVTGTTLSDDFPTLFTAGSLRSTNSGSRDVFLTQLSAAGNALLSSAYLGGSGDEWGNAITLDADENIYIVGETKSSNFPVLGALQDNYRGSTDAFIARIASIDFNPFLSIQSSAGDVQLSWSALAADYPLQSNTNLQSAGWQNVGVTPTETNGVLSVSLPATNTTEFFRLGSP